MKKEHIKPLHNELVSICQTLMQKKSLPAQVFLFHYYGYGPPVIPNIGSVCQGAEAAA
jgi:hypothetical protein